MKLKEAMKEAKRTKRPQRVDEPEHAGDTKVLVSARLDLDVLNQLKARAEAERIPYSTLINSILKRHLDLYRLGVELDLEARVSRLEKELKIG
mgnify:CR=1 FL=1